MSKIEKNKPLPDHTKLRYGECVAKVFLEHYFEERYGVLDIQDKPDLYSPKNDIGIEVTEAIDHKKKEAEKMWSTISYLDDVNEKENHIKQMERLGFPFDSEEIQIWQTPMYEDGINSKPYDILFSSLKRKLEKLKSGQYRKCSKYEIFIKGEMMPCQEWENELTLKIIRVADETGIRPNRVYLLSQNVFQMFDLEKRQSAWIDAEKEYHELACKARELVEEAEENE